MTTPKKKPGAEPAVPSAGHGFSLISNEKLLALYAAVLKCRMIEERIRLLSAGKRRASFSGRGREAAAAGVTIDLLPGDALCAPRGDLAPRFLKGVSLETIFASVSAWGDRSSASAEGGAALNVLPAAETPAVRFEAASRAARLGKRGKNKRIAVLFCGCEESADGAWEQSLRSAAAARLPMLFVCHGRPHAQDLVRQAQRCGLPGIIVDEADVLAMYRVASEAIAHGRRGNGPTLIECKPWIVQGSNRGSNQDSNAGRRSRAGNAVRTMENYLAGKGLFSRKFKAEVLSQFGRELDEAVAKAALFRKDFAKRGEGCA